MIDQTEARKIGMEMAMKLVVMNTMNIDDALIMATKIAAFLRDGSVAAKDAPMATVLSMAAHANHISETTT